MLRATWCLLPATSHSTSAYLLTSHAGAFPVSVSCSCPPLQKGHHPHEANRSSKHQLAILSGFLHLSAPSWSAVNCMQWCRFLASLLCFCNSGSL